MPTVEYSPQGEYGVGNFTDINPATTGTFNGAPVNGFTMAAGGYRPAVWLGYDDCLEADLYADAVQTVTVRDLSTYDFPDVVDIDSSITGTFDSAPVNGFTMMVGGLAPPLVFSAGDGCLFAAVNIECGDPPSGRGGRFYTHTFVITAGVPPYRVELYDGEFPPGLTLDEMTAVLSGIPTEVGLFVFTLLVTDSAGNQDTVTCSIRIICGGRSRRFLY